MGYRVHKGEDQFKVVEVVEGEIREIITNIPQSDAKKLSRHLNLGGGFDGWTPNFFLHRFEVVV